MPCSESDEVAGILEELVSLSVREKQENVGKTVISPGSKLGVRVPDIRKLARKTGKNHLLALGLWDSGVHEARILAAMVAEPDKLTEEEMEKLVREIDSWDVCDNICGELFLHTAMADRKIHEWASREGEFVRRSAFALIAYFSVHKKALPDQYFLQFFDLIRAASSDGRHYVKKSVDWALRQIGKRSIALNEEAGMLASELKNYDNRSARWIGSNSLRELKSREVAERLQKKEKKL